MCTGVGASTYCYTEVYLAHFFRYILAFGTQVHVYLDDGFVSLMFAAAANITGSYENILKGHCLQTMRLEGTKINDSVCINHD